MKFYRFRWLLGVSLSERSRVMIGYPMTGGFLAGLIKLDI